MSVAITQAVNQFVSSSTCATVNSGQSCELTVTYTPTRAGYSASSALFDLTVNSNKGWRRNKGAKKKGR